MDTPKLEKYAITKTDGTFIPCNEQITLTWKDITVTTEVMNANKEIKNDVIEMKEVKTILNKVTGLAEPGQLLAIMGSSGAGKTTLLNVLTGRSSRKLKTGGLILANGKPIIDGFKKISAFVQQHDLFLHTMTVREHLMFQAKLRMDQTISEKYRKEKIEQVLNQVGLSKCADSMIGLPTQHSSFLSGGEQRRLTLASELLTRPIVLFCDEPTSGLDSFMAENVIRALKNLADSGHTIICTIHQPSSDICAMFDRILLVAAGRCAFLGSLDSCLRFYRSIGYFCPDEFCPTDYFLNILAVKPGKEEESRKEIGKICDAFEKSSDFLAVKMGVATAAFEMTGYMEADGKDEDLYNAPWLTQLNELFKRNAKYVWRDPMLLKVAFYSYIVTAFFFGAAYFQQDNDQNGVKNIQGCVFQLIILLCGTTLMKAAKLFPDGLPLFCKEYADRTYTVTAYYIAKVYVELPLKVIFPFCEITIVYWMIGLPKSTAIYLQVIGVTILLVVACYSSGVCIGAMCSRTPMAITVANTWFLPCLIVGGFYMNISTVPVYLDWLYYMSCIPFAFEAICILIWRDVQFIECNAESMVPCLRTGQQVLSSYGLDESNFHNDIMILLASVVGFQILGLLIFWLKARRIR